MIGEILIILQAATFALMNVIDSHIVKKHVRHVQSFIPVSGLGNILIAIPLLVIFWQKNPDIWLAILAGLFYGAQAVIYYFVIEKEDVSHMIGIVYMYPLVGLIIGKLFFADSLSLVKYLGCALTIIGVVLTTQRTRGQWKILIPLAGIALFVALEEALQKGASDQVNPYFAAAIQTFVMGCTLMCCLFTTKSREKFSTELKNLKYAFLSEGLSLLAIVFLVLGYRYIPYTTASFISVIQIVFVALIEKMWSVFNPRIMHDTDLLKKTGALIVISVGVALVLL